MPRFSYIQNSFSSGEISEKLAFRNDIQEFRTGLSELTNMPPGRAGGISLRGGFRKDKTLTSASKSKIKYFSIIFNDSEIYELKVDLNDGSITLYDKVNSEFYTSINGYASSNFVITSSDASTALQALPLGNFQIAQIENALVLVHDSGLEYPFIFYRTEEDTNVTGPITREVFFKLSLWSESGLTINDKAIVKPLQRIPTYPPNTTTITIALSGTYAVGNSIAMTASTGSSLFRADHVGGYFFVDDGTGKAVALEITVVSADFSDTATGVIRFVDSGFANGTYDYWYEGSWSKHRGFPKAVVVHEGSLVFGGTKHQSETYWGSASANVYHMNNYFIPLIGTTEIKYERSNNETGEPWSYRIPYPIAWMSSDRSLLIGSSLNTYLVTGGDNIISPTNAPFQRRVSSEGGATIQPAYGADSIYYVSRDRKSIIEISYSAENGSYVSRNLSILSEDIIYKGVSDRSNTVGDSNITKIVWQESTNTLWVLTSSLKVIGITVVKSAGINAFHSTDMPSTDVYEIAVIPNSTLTFDDFYAVAYNASFTSDLSLLKQVATFEHGTLFSSSPLAKDLPVFLDYGATIGRVANAYAYTAVDTTKLTVLGSDGVIYTDVEVTSNSFTLSGTPATVIAGLPYTGVMKTLRLEVGPNNNLNSQGDVFRVERATIQLYKTFAGQYGSESENGDEATDLYDFEIDDEVSYTGKVVVDLPQNSDIDSRMVISTNKPLPLTIVGIVFRGQNHG